MKRTVHAVPELTRRRHPGAYSAQIGVRQESIQLLGLRSAIGSRLPDLSLATSFCCLLQADCEQVVAFRPKKEKLLEKASTGYDVVRTIILVR